MNKTTKTGNEVEFEMRFSQRQVKAFVKGVKVEIGAGWSLFSGRIQEALLTEKALWVLAGQMSENIPTSAISQLVMDMLVEAGLTSAE